MSSHGLEVAHVAAERAVLVRFARSLLADDSVPEDAAHDAWVAALRRKSAAGAHPLPWMMVVVRNLIHRSRRDRKRRQAREAAYGTLAETAAPGADEALERLETQRQLVEAVQGLDEPFRSTVLWVYFEGLSPSELAARSGVPAGTVRWRLKTGLDGARRALARDNDGYTRRALVLFAMDRPSGLPFWNTTLAMKTSTKGLVVVASIVAVLLTVAIVARRPRGPSPSPGGASPSSALDGDDPEVPEAHAVGRTPSAAASARVVPPRFVLPRDDAGHVSAAVPQAGSERNAPQPRLAARADHPPDAEELARRARVCEVRWDVPGAKSDEKFQSQGWATDQDLAALGLPDAELEIAKRAIGRYKDALAVSLRAAIEEVEGRSDPSLAGVDVDALEARLMEFMGRHRRGEMRRARRNIAQELAGLRQPTADGERSLGERLYRSALSTGDEFERDLARDVGERRAAELRAVLSGRQTNVGCP